MEIFQGTQKEREEIINSMATLINNCKDVDDASSLYDELVSLQEILSQRIYVLQVGEVEMD